MRLLACFTAFAVAMAIPAEARLGETLAQLTARFGPAYETRPPLVPGTKHLLFFRQNVAIDVSLVDGRSGCEVYSGSNGHDLTHADFQALLNDNAEGQTWTPQTDNPGASPGWIRTDGALAVLSGSSVIQFSAVEYLKIEKAYKDSQAPNVKGF